MQSDLPWHATRIVMYRLSTVTGISEHRSAARIFAPLESAASSVVAVCASRGFGSENLV